MLANVLYVNFSVKCLKYAPKWTFSYFGGHFCYHSNGKCRINTRVLHFGYCSNKLIKRNYWKATFIVFGLIGEGGGAKELLNACSSFYGHSPPSADSRRVVVSNKWSMCPLSLACPEKCGYVNLLSPHNHTCWLRCKESNQTNRPSVILLPAHPASFAHKFLFQRVPASPGMQ